MTKTMSSCVALVAGACAATACIGAGHIEDHEVADETQTPGWGEVVLDGARAGDLLSQGTLLPVVAPPPGTGVFAEMIFADGTTLVRRVEVDLDGDVFELTESLDAGADLLYAGVPAPCADGAYSLLQNRWKQRFDWSFNASTTPGNLGAAAVEGALQAGTRNITASRNDCGLADSVSATQLYLGRTSAAAGIRADGSCRDTDSKNVVDFGDLPAGVLGVTCTWYLADGTATESDVRLNKVDSAWYVTKPAGCSNRFSIEGVMTHERGHTFGLGHVAEATHGRLTMSTSIGPCDGSPSTLGLGDVRAVRRRY